MINITAKFKSREDAAKKIWDTRYTKTKPYLKRNVDPHVRNFLNRYGDEFKKGSILDIGCGNGRNTKYVAKLGFKTYGIDISKSAIAQLKEILKEDKLEADVRVGSFYKIPYKKATFDYILSMRVFQHNDWKGAEKSFSEVSRVLKKNGLFLLSVRSTKMRQLPGERVPDRGITFVQKAGKKAGIILHHYSREELEELAARNSLMILSMQEIVYSRKEGLNAHWIVSFRKI